MAFNQPNYYGNPYGNPYMQNYGAMNYQNQTPQYVPSQVQQTTLSQPTQQLMLYGKVVDNYNTADSQDVPIGMSGIYPKADGNAVFIKKWLDNGTTKTYEYKLIEQNSEEMHNLPTFAFEEKYNELCQSIDELGKKIDKLTPTPTPPKKKRVVEEVDEDDE